MRNASTFDNRFWFRMLLILASGVGTTPRQWTLKGGDRRVIRSLVPTSCDLHCMQTTTAGGSEEGRKTGYGSPTGNEDGTDTTIYIHLTPGKANELLCPSMADEGNLGCGQPESKFRWSHYEAPVSKFQRVPTSEEEHSSRLV